MRNWRLIKQSAARARLGNRIRRFGLVSAALKENSIPERALLRAAAGDIFAFSPPVWDEVAEVFERPKLTRRITLSRRTRIKDLLLAQGSWFDPAIRVRGCRDPGDDKFLELALAADAKLLVSGDKDLLALHPWRNVRILTPAGYLASRSATP